MLSLPHTLYIVGLKTLLWARHVERMDVSLKPWKVMGGCFGRRKSVGKARGRWKDVVRREAVDFLKIKELVSSSKKQKRFEQKLKNATAGQRAEAPWNKRVNNVEWMNSVLKNELERMRKEVIVT